MSILIKNGRVITASDDYVADIFVEGETISAIGKNISNDADTIIDATGKFVLPGGIDPHVHLDMPFMGTFSSDNYETGTLAALHGGTTMVIDFILQTQGKSLHNALHEYKAAAMEIAMEIILFIWLLRILMMILKKKLKRWWRKRASYLSKLLWLTKVH